MWFTVHIFPASPMYTFMHMHTDECLLWNAENSQKFSKDFRRNQFDCPLTSKEKKINCPRYEKNSFFFQMSPKVRHCTQEKIKNGMAKFLATDFGAEILQIIDLGICFTIRVSATFFVILALTPPSSPALEPLATPTKAMELGFQVPFWVGEGGDGGGIRGQRSPSLEGWL